MTTVGLHPRYLDLASDFGVVTLQSHEAIPAPVRGLSDVFAGRVPRRDMRKTTTDRASAKGVQRPPVTVCRTTPSASVHARINSVTDCRRTQRSPRERSLEQWKVHAVLAIA